jgi:oligopeptide transport system substrate-binding protein
MPQPLLGQSCQWPLGVLGNGVCFLRSRARTWGCLWFFAWLSIVLCGCGRSLDRAELVFINGAEPELLDPALVTAQATSRIAYALFEGLVIFDQEAKVQPGVAERWEISQEGTEYTFHLRSKACWSNGEQVTSADFMYAWRRALLPETGAEYASQLYPIANAEAFNTAKINDFNQVGVSAPDSFTLKVRLSNPTPYFLDLCAFSTFLPVHRATVEAHPDWASKPAHFVGNGPYLLEEWRLFDRVRLSKNPRYWNASEVSLKSIDVLPAARPNTAFNLYSTGAADLMLDKGLAPTPLLDELRKRSDFHSDPFLATYFIRFNASRAPFSDSRVRRAVSLVVNRRELVEKITRGGEPPAESFVPPGTGSGYVPTTEAKRDPEAARKLLSDAGFPGGAGFPVVRYLYKGDSDLDRDIAVEIQGALQRELGIRMLLQPQEWTVYLALQGALDYDMCRSSWVADYNDPNTFLNMFVTGDGNNRTGWSNASYDALVAAAAAEPETARRFEAFQKAERILVVDEAAVCPLYFYVGIQFYDSKRLGGISPNLLDEHPLRFLHWKQP